jgi:hypothetical protein
LAEIKREPAHGPLAKLAAAERILALEGILQDMRKNNLRDILFHDYLFE